MPAHQCPRCELLFSFRSEVEAHLATDHRPVDPANGRRGDDARAHSDAGTSAPTAAAPLSR